LNWLRKIKNDNKLLPQWTQRYFHKEHNDYYKITLCALCVLSVIRG